MDIYEAGAMAGILLAAMQPFCERIEVAGSIRRGKPDGIKDVELVAVPRWHEGVNLLHAWAESDEALDGTGLACWIKTGVKDRAIVPWDVKDSGRYWKGLLVNGATLDLFLTRPENFGAQFLIRTGSADFSKAVVTHALRVGFRFSDGDLWHQGDGTFTPLPTPDEADVFALLGLQAIAPALRRDSADVRRSK